MSSSATSLVAESMNASSVMLSSPSGGLAPDEGQAHIQAYTTPGSDDRCRDPRASGEGRGDPEHPVYPIGQAPAPTPARRGSRLEVFNSRELAVLLTAAQRDDPESHPFLLTLARTGLRLGEAVGLEWRDVDSAQRVLVVRRSVRQGRVSLPKNGKTRRVDMSPQLAECLAGLRSLQAAEAALEGRAAPERCFRAQADVSHWRSYVWAPILRRAGLRYRKPHTLRHTYASLLLERRESLHYVQQQLGHHFPAFTLTVYGHLIPREGARAVDALDTPPAPHESASLPQAGDVTPRYADEALNLLE